jgi:hypothetical protein
MEFYSSSTPYFLCYPINLVYLHMVATWDFHALERERL